MSIPKAFAVIEARDRAEMIHRTFGHLEPATDSSHTGTILFVNGEYGDAVIVESEFKSLNDGGSPLFHEVCTDYVNEKTNEGKACEKVGVYRFTGIFKVYKNGKAKLIGKARRIKSSLLA
jgi:hypothetical protein